MVEMKPWAEDNFLERLMPQLRQVNRVRLESCPDSELLTAFVEEQVTPFVRGAITTHLATCPECSEVCARLANFARASVPQQDPEWANVEKRLNNAMESFLATKAPKHAAAQDAGARQGFVLGWKNAPRQLFPWRIAFASAGALAVVIVGGVFAFMHQSKPDNMSARQAPVPQVVVTAEPSTQNSAQPAVPAPPAQQVATQTAQPPAPVRKLEKPSPSNAAGSPKSSKPHAEHPNTDQIANTGSAPVVIQNPNDHMPGSQRAPMGSGITQATVHIPSPRPGPVAVPQTPAQQASTPQAPTPASVILGEGERLFIQVSSMSRQGDGTFTFHGTLLQPVNFLVPGTEVFGRGSDADGKTVILVTRFLLQGQRYDLVGSPSDLSEVQPGAGKAVQFDNGQVFEMWFSIGSTYQKAR